MDEQQSTEPENQPPANADSEQSQPTPGETTTSQTLPQSLTSEPETVSPPSGSVKPEENLAPQSGDMVVDPRPTAPPIHLGDTEYKFPPAAASSDAVLALEPNVYEDATEGPHPQVSQTTYVTWTRPDGGTFLAPISSDETYERKGYQRGAEEEIPDLVAYNREMATSDEERRRQERSREAIEQQDRDRRELLERHATRRREQASAH